MTCRVLVWGAGKFGQLGNGVRTDITDPQDISRTLNVKNSRVVQVSQKIIMRIMYVCIT